ncbi:hypothetical protein KO516_17070 [Citreicella sp. C3M06]|uniref:hypothetical protein n=1 Tax=Citreicella sp. C3M06 TaxID=2841564 RepID=UPI001C0898F4|nr:hypothetical protein [Citreicella sp. C3M06]MBU2962501.1 hypothetical protein [Citreicella sp. C3M06]
MRAMTFLGALAAVTVGASGAFAWGDAYTGDATSDLSRQPLVQAWPQGSHCPAGKQPVIVGGAIFCGIPTAGRYYDPQPLRASHAPKPAAKAYLPRAYAPAGEKGVVSQ